tara:strand:- start:99 stop:635 length:537 start_codon:yes stop_codon:yes gene_type:complete
LIKKSLCIIVLLTSASLYAQNYKFLVLKNLNKTVSISPKQNIEIYSSTEQRVIRGRFYKIDQEKIFLAQTKSIDYQSISINEVKEIKLLSGSKMHHNLKGFIKGGLTCGGITSAFFGALTMRQGTALDSMEIFIMLFAIPSATIIGGIANTIKYNIQYIDTFEIDQDNWGIVMNKVIQ